MSCAQIKRSAPGWSASDARHHGSPCPGGRLWHHVRGHRFAVASAQLYTDTTLSAGRSCPHQIVPPHVCMPPGIQRTPIASLPHRDSQEVHALHSASSRQATQHGTLWEQAAALATACSIAATLLVGGPISPAEARARLTQVCKLGCMCSRLYACQLTDQKPLHHSRQATSLCRADRAHDLQDEQLTIDVFKRNTPSVVYIENLALR